MKINLKNKIFLLMAIILVPMIARANMIMDPETLITVMLVMIFVNALIEVISSVAFFNVQKVKKKKRLIAFIILANLISYPIFITALNYFDYLLSFPLLSAIGYDAGLYFIGFFLEILVFLFEYIFIYHWNKKYISKKQALSLCMINNIASLMAGFFINPFFS